MPDENQPGKVQNPESPLVSNGAVKFAIWQSLQTLNTRLRESYLLYFGNQAQKDNIRTERHKRAWSNLLAQLEDRKREIENSPQKDNTLSNVEALLYILIDVTNLDSRPSGSLHLRIGCATISVTGLLRLEPGYSMAGLPSGSQTNVEIVFFQADGNQVTANLLRDGFNAFFEKLKTAKIDYKNPTQSSN